jgi:glycosyltransferase involved in cell wall biosynthesis
MGLPVISTRQNGATEIMTDGVHGRVLASADEHDALVAAMRELSDPATRDRMRRSCLALRPRLAYEAHVSRLESIYQRVIDARRGVR